MEKESGDVIILHMCTKNHNHIMYAFWDMECDWYCFLSFWTIFCPFLPHYWPQKLKFGKNVTHTWRYYPFTQLYHDWRSYDVWFLRKGAGETVFLFFFLVILNHFLPFHPPLKCQKSKFLKNEKNIEDIIILHKSTVNENHIMYDSWDMNCKRQIFLSFWHFCHFI